MPPLEQHQPSEQAQPQPQQGHAIQSAVHETWGPQPGFKLNATYTESPSLSLGATADSAYTQSLATQYDNLGQSALNGIGNGVKAMLAVGAFGLELVGDAASVVAADLQIGYEAVTYPALADANSDALGQHLRQLGAKYEPVLQPIKQGYQWMEHDLNNIGAQSNTDNSAYARLLNDPASNIAHAVDKFTGQTPDVQVTAIADQATQIAALGLAERALAGAALSTAQISAKFDQLFAKIDAELNRFKTPRSSDYSFAMATDRGGIQGDGNLSSKSVGKNEAEIKASNSEREPLLNREYAKDGIIAPADGKEAVDQIRELLRPLFKDIDKKNIAFAEINIEGKPTLLAAINGGDSPVGTVALIRPTNLEGAVNQGVLFRDRDSEYKILDAIAQDLPKNATGTIAMFTEQKPCSVSCVKVFKKFRERFENITFTDPTWIYENQAERLKANCGGK